MEGMIGRVDGLDVPPEIAPGTITAVYQDPSAMHTEQCCWWLWGVQVQGWLDLPQQIITAA
jgi:hypothetical protein